MCDHEVLWANELENARKSILELLKSGDQVLTVSVTGAIAALVALQTTDQGLAVVGLPYLLTVPALYVLRLNGIIQLFGGYRKALEKRLNGHHGQRDLLVFEDRIAPLQKKSLHAAALYVSLAAVWLALMSDGEYQLVAHDASDTSTCLVSVGYVACAALTVASYVSGLKLFARSYQEADRALAKDLA